MGIRAVKAESGLVMVQEPESSEYNGMPENAIATGMADFVLPPAEMGKALAGYESHAFGKELLKSVQPALFENQLNKIFILIRNHIGHDFSNYKPSTIKRRIERRMAIHQINDIELYVKYLQKESKELDALFRDFLIGVTGFFRDTEAFSLLEKYGNSEAF